MVNAGFGLVAIIGGGMGIGAGLEVGDWLTGNMMDRIIVSCYHVDFRMFHAHPHLMVKVEAAILVSVKIGPLLFMRHLE